MKLEELPKAFAESNIDRALSRTGEERGRALLHLEQLGLENIPVVKRQGVAAAFYSNAKYFLSQQHIEQATKSIRSAHQLHPENALFIERLHLLERTVDQRTEVAWRMSMHEMQRRLGAVCVKRVCTCKSHYKIARCLGLIESGFPCKDNVRGNLVYSLGPYRPYSGAGKWSNLLKAIKRYGKHSLLEAMADIVADFVLEDTDLMKRVDVVVPVPPSPDKFGRRGFAPNDIVGHRLQTRLALPFVGALLRKVGIETREADWDQLAGQFSVEWKGRQGISNPSVLLIEDVWTRGRTIPICAEKLRAHGAKEVYAIALGRTQG